MKVYFLHMFYVFAPCFVFISSFMFQCLHVLTLLLISLLLHSHPWILLLIDHALLDHPGS